MFIVFLLSCLECRSSEESWPVFQTPPKACVDKFDLLKKLYGFEPHFRQTKTCNFPSLGAIHIYWKIPRMTSHVVDVRWPHGGKPKFQLLDRKHTFWRWDCNLLFTRRSMSKKERKSGAFHRVRISSHMLNNNLASSGQWSNRVCFWWREKGGKDVPLATALATDAGSNSNADWGTIIKMFIKRMLSIYIYKGRGEGYVQRVAVSSFFWRSSNWRCMFVRSLAIWSNAAWSSSTCFVLVSNASDLACSFAVKVANRS